ncbi:MAG: hypothetical protein QXF74_04625 [Nitrososphaerota archaeon]
MSELVLVKVSKITSNDSTPLLYIPKKVVRALGLRKGIEVKLLIDPEAGRLIVEKLEPIGRRAVK